MINTKTFITKFRVFLTSIFGKPFSAIPDHLVEDSEIISFDVFDTLIIRPGLSVPSELFDLIYPNDKSFKDKRIEAEKKARIEGRRNGFEEITLTDIYKFLYPKRPTKELESIMQKEIETELAFCKPNPNALAFYNNCRERQHPPRIIIVSDMYLSASVISTILVNSGYDISGVNIYVSSECGRTKRVGNLFKKVISDEHMKGKERKILHIGDNTITDYLMARKVGIKGIICRTHISNTS